jgi:hypothetical protein
VGTVLRKGVGVLHGIAPKLDLGSSNVMETTASSLEERASRKETIAGIDLQLIQCQAVVTNCATLDDAQDFTRRLRAGSIQAVVSWSRGDQELNWPKRPYSVKVPFSDRERALNVISRQTWIFAAPQSNSAALAFSRTTDDPNRFEPASTVKPGFDALFDGSLLSLSLGEKHPSNMIRNLEVAEPIIRKRE